MTNFIEVTTIRYKPIVRDGQHQVKIMINIAHIVAIEPSFDQEGLNSRITTLNTNTTKSTSFYVVETYADLCKQLSSKKV